MLEKKKAPVAMDMKSRIYYARTYRHLEFNKEGTAIFCLFFILPALVMLLLFYDEITMVMCQIVSWILERAGVENLGLNSTEFIPWLGPAWYVCAPTRLPQQMLVLENILVCAGIGIVLGQGPWKGKPLSIYLLINVLIHLMGCVFFLLGSEVFPYTANDYAKLYVTQEIGIWVAFLVLGGIVEATLGRGGVLIRCLTVLSILAYSFLFGTVRYALFLWIIHQYSLLYMPLMFFTLGPFFDFLYFVLIYSLSTSRMMHKNDGRGKNQWQWA